MYDVIVIGAGPCGSVASGVLAAHGLKTLMIEKCKLPRYKSCSGVLIEKSLKFIEKNIGRVPSGVTCTPADTRGMIFTDDGGKEYKFESRGLNIMRDKFDFWLTELARGSGAIVKDDRSVISVCESDGVAVVTDNRGSVERANFVIDCAGAVGIGKPRDCVITYQTYNIGTINLDPHYFYAYLQPELSGYDAWFNIKDGMLVLGVAASDAKDVKSYYDKFIDYMTCRHALTIDSRTKTDKWLIRKVDADFDIDLGYGRVLKAGESAGFLNPMGEGISSALESGYECAHAVLSNLYDSRKAMEEYRSRVEKTTAYMKRQWQLLGKISAKFSHIF